MNDEIKISVIMPSLNVEDYIEECILSVMNQTLKDIEIICVDANSTDSTLDILKNMPKRLKNQCNYFKQEKLWSSSKFRPFKSKRGIYQHN